MSDKRKLLRFISRAGMALVLLVGLVMPLSVALGAEAVVTCTVTAQLVAVSVTDGSVDYGILQAGAFQDTVTLGDTQWVTNNGTVTEDFNIKSSDAIGASANWTLSDTQGVNQFTHWFWSEYDEEWILLTTAYQLMDAEWGVGEETYFDLQIGMPTGTTDYGTHNITVTIQAVATGGPL